MMTREEALYVLKNTAWLGTEKKMSKVVDAIETLSNDPQRWIPVKTRPMDEEEREYWEERTGVELEDEDAVFFDCQMPDDGQEVWVCYKSGRVSEDVCERDDFCGLEGNGDWSDIVAWMPRIKPEPYKGGAE